MLLTLHGQVTGLEVASAVHTISTTTFPHKPSTATVDYDEHCQDISRMYRAPDMMIKVIILTPMRWEASPE